MSVGGASVSAKHANFIVAGTGATATDVLELIQAVRERVLAQSGVLLEPEVHLVGDLDLAIR
jgi:UDP-N-acetylmuramate dehydrogenase